MKYKEAFLSKIRSWYASMSIRDKMRIFIEIIAALVIIITLFSFFVFELYRSDFETMLEDNYNTNAVLASFAIEESAFRDYASVRNDETQLTYNRSYQETTTSIQNLRYNFEEMGLERFWRTRMIRLSYDAYREQCAKVLAMSYEDEEYIKELYFAYTIGNNIISCTKRLIEVTLSESTAIYNSKIVFLETFPVICFIAGSVIILFAFVINSIMVKNIVEPIQSLADEAKEISKNNYNTPDVIVSNQDEIGDLVAMFNKMKHTSYEAITSLQEKNKMAMRLHEEEIQRIEAEKNMRTMQMLLLKSQINPHFLFNTLNTISCMAKLEAATTTEDIIQRLSNIFRYSLQTPNEKVTLGRELAIIEDYIYIQRKRYGSRIRFIVQSSIQNEDVMVPTFTLQPLVENSLIHGLSSKENGGFILIKAKEKEERIYITVTDNGVGIPQSEVEAMNRGSNSYHGDSFGIGIGNLRARVNLYEENGSFTIYSKQGVGTSIQLVLKKRMYLHNTI